MFNCILIGYWLTNFLPLTDWLSKKVVPRIKNKYISKLLICWMCQSFWFVLIFGSLYIGYLLVFEAILASLIVYTYQKIMNSIKIFI